MSTLLFDVNETLSDLAGMRQAFTEIGADPGLAPGWFAGALRDGFALTILGKRPSFADVARAGLRTILAGTPDRSVDDAVDQVLERFADLDVHPDVAPGVRVLAEAGHRLATLSNGSASVAESLLSRAGVREAFDAVLSVQDAPAWKPDPRAYRYAADRLGGTDDLVLVAVHPWDVAGAGSAGLRGAWLNRSGQPWPEIFTAPELEVRAVAELAARL